MSTSVQEGSKRKRQSSKNVDPKVKEVRRKIQVCCSKNDLTTAMETIKSALSDGIKIEAQTFYNLINLCDGFAEKGVHVGTPKPGLKNDQPSDDSSTADLIENTRAEETSPITHSIHGEEISNQQRKEYAFMVKGYMDYLKLPLIETAYTALIKILCRTGDLDEAESILIESEKCEQCKPRLRLYSPLLAAYAEQGDMNGAVRIWSHMCKVTKGTEIGGEESIEPTEREFLHLINCATKVGDIRVFERVLSEIAEDVFIPSVKTTEAIINWFQSEQSVAMPNGTSSKSSALDQVDLPESDTPYMGPVHYICKPNDKSAVWEVHRCCLVDTRTGVLTKEGFIPTKLLPVDLSDKAWNEMIVMNESLVLKGEVDGDFTKFAGGGKGKKRVVTESLLSQRNLQWQAFKKFLEEQVGSQTTITMGYDNLEKIQESSMKRSAYDFVIDGANVGYYKQNFANAPKHVDYQQIDWLVDHLLALNKRILLVLHERHFSHYLMPKWASPIAEKWKRLGVLYCTPAGSNDDWFWMHAALCCGRDTLVISNDEMRDHWFQMLAYRSFLRWKERHQVHFSFGAWTKDCKRRQVELTYPDVYSRRIQRLNEFSLVIPLPKQGDKNRFLDGTHEADETYPMDETYVYICLKTDANDVSVL